jgi:aromatic ring-cleaving dioxygenase
MKATNFPPIWKKVGYTDTRTDIALAIAHNGIFFKPSLRQAVEQLMNEMSIRCNVELGLAAGNDYGDLTDTYFQMANKTTSAIEILYKELNLG